MGTNKPRIQAYVEQSLFNSFKAEQDAWGMTQSEAIEQILAERYFSNDLVLPIQSKDLNHRVILLETKVAGQEAINVERFEQLFSRLERLEALLLQSGLSGDSPASDDSPIEVQ